MHTDKVEQVAAVTKVIKDASPAIEGKVIELMDALQHGVVHIGDKIVEYSPTVADAALWVIRIDGLQALANGVYYLISACLLLKATKNLVKWAHTKANDGFEYVPCIISGALTFWFSVLACDIFFAIWNWIMIFEPKLWLAKQIIAGIMKQ